MPIACLCYPGVWFQRFFQNGSAGTVNSELEPFTAHVLTLFIPRESKPQLRRAPSRRTRTSSIENDTTDRCPCTNKQNRAPKTASCPGSPSTLNPSAPVPFRGLQPPSQAPNMSNACVTPDVSLAHLPLILQQIPDVLLEISSHLPRESALCLALTCKPLYFLLFHRALRRLNTGEKDRFLFTLLKEIRNKYYCHNCSKMFPWRCPHKEAMCATCPRMSFDEPEHWLFNQQQHACLRARGAYISFSIPGMDAGGDFERRVLHLNRTGFQRCCQKSTYAPL